MKEDYFSQLNDYDAPFCEQQYTHGFKSFNPPPPPQTTSNFRHLLSCGIIGMLHPIFPHDIVIENVMFLTTHCKNVLELAIMLRCQSLPTEIIILKPIKMTSEAKSNFCGEYEPQALAQSLNYD